MTGVWHAAKVPHLAPHSNALAFPASDEACYITGVTLPIDAGRGIR
jgi:hypothetical protein